MGAVARGVRRRGGEQAGGQHRRRGEQPADERQGDERAGGARPWRGHPGTLAHGLSCVNAPRPVPSVGVAGAQRPGAVRPAATLGRTPRGSPASGRRSPRMPARRFAAAISAILPRVARDADAMCGTTRQFGRLSSGCDAGIGSGSVTSRPRRGDDRRRAARRPAPSSRPRARARCSRGSPWASSCASALGVDQVARLGGEVDVERHEVALGEELVEWHERARRAPFDRGLRAGRRRGRGPHAEAASPAAPPPGRSARTRRCRAWRRGRRARAAAAAPTSSSGPART